MNEPVTQRPRFTLLQLLAVVTAISIVLGISMPIVRRRQEQSQQSQCSNNLRQLALGAHLYHDTKNELPPLATDPQGWTWIELIVPYVEQLPRENSPGYPGTRDPTNAANSLAFIQWYHTPTLLCPTRRTEGKRASGQYAGAQPTDYVAISTSNALKWDSDGDGMIVYRLTNSSPITRLRSATTFGSVVDGTVNTFMIGEKHMRPDWLGGQYDEPALVAIEDPNTIRVATDQLGGKPLAGSREDDDPWKFGSWHDGATLFAMGDASVRPFPNGSDPRVLRLLSGRNDNEPVEVQ